MLINAKPIAVRPADALAGVMRAIRAAGSAGRVALIALHAAALAAVLAEWLYPLSEDAHGVERVHALDFFASYAVFGFVACVILVLLGIVLRRVVMRSEDYYTSSKWW